MKEKFEDRRMDGLIDIKLSDKGAFAGQRWTADKAVLVNHMIDITSEYDAQGYKLTLRQLYYQLVRRNYILNDDNVYAKMSAILDDCRYAGVVDWDMIEDRTRVPHTPYFENDIPSALQKTYDCYWLDKRQNQPVYVELWTEKDALSEIMRRAVHDFTITTVVNKGFASSTAIYTAYKKFAQIIHRGQHVIVLYFGDHDPSGLDMIRDIRDRLLTMFRAAQGNAPWWQALKPKARYNKVNNPESYDTWLNDAITDIFHMIDKRFEIRHIGLTRAQIEQYNLPPNPAKLTDPRAKEYVAQHGEISWEVDALEPSDIVNIVQDELTTILDDGVLNEVLAREKRERTELSKLIKQFTE